MAKSIEQKFGARLREVRTEKGISQEKLGEIAEVHRTYVGLIERGRRNVSLQMIEKLAIALEIEPRDLMP